MTGAPLWVCMEEKRRVVFQWFELFYLCGGLGGLCFQYAVLFIFLKFGFAQIGVRSKEAKANEESMTPRSPSPLTFPTACMDLNACGWTLSTACDWLVFCYPPAAGLAGVCQSTRGLYESR